MKIDIDYVRAQLKRRADERQLAKVARMSEVAISTLRRLINGESSTTSTVERLQDFLTKREKVRKLDENEPQEDGSDKQPGGD